MKKRAKSVYGEDEDARHEEDVVRGRAARGAGGWRVESGWMVSMVESVAEGGGRGEKRVAGGVG